ncbi:MAG: hypothetical protein ACRBBN_06065 [Methyloligellaceae bacterium]
MINDIFSWFTEILGRAIKINQNNFLAPDLNLKYLETLGILLGIGLIGVLIAAIIYRRSIPGFLGGILNILVGIAGAITGSFLFLTYVYNIVPAERGLRTFDNTYDLDFLIGTVIGGVIGSMIATLIFRLVFGTLFGKR